MLSALGEAGRRAERERKEDVEAARRELAPVFEAVVAAGGGDREARGALEDICPLLKELRPPGLSL
ncbi:hypothetical protein [Actinomadura rifamycini]|uniref:hypothetical protein n=1 Tax=Actinomadura rifamycini TaxID=31962 RepID=UPI00040CC723|nr:hypothetical protein [Actinomadura rifamycini]